MVEKAKKNAKMKKQKIDRQKKANAIIRLMGG